MSWIKQLAVKAEAALEKIDSEAASILKKDKVKHHTTGSNLEHKRSSSYNSPSQERLSTVNVDSRSWSTSAHNSLNSSPKDLISRKRNFNNSTAQKNTPKEAFHSRQSSSSSFGSSCMPGSERESPGIDMDTSVDSGHVGSLAGMEVQNPFRSSASSSVSTNYSESHNFQDAYPASSSMSECDMLRREVSSLNQEMQQVLRRAKEAESESERVKGDLVVAERMRNEVLQHENQQKKSKRQVEWNADETVTASADNLPDTDVSSRLSAVDDVNHNDSKKVLKERLEEAKCNLQLEEQSNNKLKEQFTARIRELENKHRISTDELSICQQRLESVKLSSNTYSHQISSLKSELVDNQQKFDEYKAKAGRILEEKDRLFDSVTQSREGGVGSPDNIFQQEIAQFKTERDFLQEELVSSGKIVHGLRMDLAEVELAAEKEHNSNLEQLALAEKDSGRLQNELEVAKEQKYRTELELRSIQEEFTKVKHTLDKRLEVRDEEIDKLQKQIAHKISSSVGISELENRIHSLTEALILKQNNIESLSADRHTLAIQCEKLQEQYSESQMLLNSDVKIYVGDEHHRQPSFLTESPFDGGVTRRVKKAYGSVDKVSIRLGTFLRRYPAARLLIFMYMGLLHLWVMIVLLTYTPEIHDTNHNNG